MASLGAKKGQLWLHRNHRRLTIPIRAHVGAVMARAVLDRGVLWRLKEELHLRRRYAHDGHHPALPLSLVHARPTAAVLNRWDKLKSGR